MSILVFLLGNLIGNGAVGGMPAPTAPHAVAPEMSAGQCAALPPPHVLLLRQIQLRHQRCLPAQSALRPHPHLGGQAALPAAQGCAVPHSGAGGHQWGRGWAAPTVGHHHGAQPSTTGHQQPLSPPQTEREQRRWLHKRPHDLVLVLVLLLMASFTFFRGMVSTGGGQMRRGEGWRGADFALQWAPCRPWIRAGGAGLPC